MSCCEIGDMDIVADAGSIRRGIIRAVNRYARSFSQGGLAGDLDEVCGASSRLASPEPRIGAGNVEVTQGSVHYRMCCRSIAKHEFGHHLGGAVGRFRS